jgi:2-dehydro-3-deoxygluconokinase
MAQVVTFGETMIRLSPPDFLRLEQATSLNVSVGGSELTVAAGVARLGLTSTWVSRLPTNALGRMVQDKAREHGVDTSHIVWADGGRVGLYFVEYGASPRASSVLYDRSHSAIASIQPNEIDWDGILKGAELFHVSGITPALSESAAKVTAKAIEAAKKHGLLVSYDLNYRAKLWSEERARAVQEPLMSLVDILITTEEDTERVFGIRGPSYEDVALQLACRFGMKVVTITLRGTPSVWRNTWSAIAVADEKCYRDTTYEIEIVDRVGGGDNYSAGFLYGYLTRDVEYALRLGNAFTALKQTSWGDFNYASLAEAEQLMKGSSLRIAR